MREVLSVLRVDWISTTGASEDLNKLLNNFIPQESLLNCGYAILVLGIYILDC